MGKAKNKGKKEDATMQAAQTTAPTARGVIPDEPDRGVRPTTHQMRSGAYQLPAGPGRQDRPAVNTRPDFIAVLMVAPAQLDGIQHDAARDWQALRADVIAEIGLRGYRSCLDIAIAGHDESDGNAPLMSHWRMVNRVLGRRRCALLDRVCLDGCKPVDLEEFRAALDAFAIVSGRA